MEKHISHIRIHTLFLFFLPFVLFSATHACIDSLLCIGRQRVHLYVPPVQPAVSIVVDLRVMSCGVGFLQEVAAILKHARDCKLAVRVIGSGHSPNATAMTQVTNE